MTVERHEVGPRMSQIVIHGNTVYLAGIVAQNSGGKSVADQTKEILATIDGYLAKAGTVPHIPITSGTLDATGVADSLARLVERRVAGRIVLSAEQAPVRVN